MIVIYFNMIILPQLPLYAIAIICGLLSFLATRIVMPKIIRKMKEADIVGKDIHKSWKPVVAEMGGFGILFGFTLGIFSGVYMHEILAFPLVIVLVVILLVGMIGILDDLLALSSRDKFLLLFIAGLPLIWAAPNNVGLLYLITIPIALSIGSNLTNMLAGLNGIESGLGVISMTSLTIACIILGKYDVTIISMSMLGALIAFLYYNRYPAKIFPGDTGTLIIGAAIVCIAFIGRVKLIALIIMMPNIIDAALKFYSAGVMNRQQQKPTQINDEGKLVRPEVGFKSLIRLVLRKPIAEKDAVKIIWAIGIVFGALGIIVALVMPGMLENQTLVNFLHVKEMFYHI
jgi:UDP-N-acetylglucosamine--dolichyl-phosphate N-acetylglucosaminephosphotransferase